MKVSLVMSVYNGEEYLKETINSILAQTYPNLEIIIVNNGSTDSTSTILSEINDERVKVIHLDENEGAASALNAGIAQAEGEWIAIHDADDVSMPDRIEEQVAYVLKNPHVVAIGSFIECIPGNNYSESADNNFRLIEGLKNSIVSWEQFKEELFKGCPFTHGSLLISKEVLSRVGKYNPNYKIAYDYDLVMRLAYAGPIENMPKILYKYRIHPKSLSNSSAIGTSNELLLIGTKYIWKYCFPYKENEPNVIVFGSEEGCEVFKNLMSIGNSAKVQGMISNFSEAEAAEAYISYKLGRIDAFIILPAPQRYDFVEFLTSKGLKLNKDFFLLWSAL